MQALPGFRDFLPDQCAGRNYIFARWREVARRYGFVEWEGPVLEATELYKKKSGAEIVDKLFNFTDCANISSSIATSLAKRTLPLISNSWRFASTPCAHLV